MENETKKEAPLGAENRKNRPHRKRGYFIDPARPSEQEPPKITQQAPSAPSQKGCEDSNASGGKGHPNPSGAHTSDRPKQNGNRENGNDKSHASRKPKKKRDGNNGRPNESAAESTPKEQKSAPVRNDRPRNPQRGKQGGGGGNSSRPNRTNDRLTPIKANVPTLSDEEYDEVPFPAPEPTPVVVEEPTEPPVMVEVIGVRFKNSGKVYYFAPANLSLKRGEFAIVETARGQEYGEVALGNTMVKESDTVPPLRPILRKATAEDAAHHAENKKKEEEAFRICNDKITSHGLEMKLIDAQYTFDNTKLLFYFTSAGRVDFRDLVKDLASVFRTRIELRQIGIRDEAKLIGGMGMCGRPLCCTRFLSDFGQVSIKMAKEQNLSLNSAKISGICGRLMCCLRYEHEAYEYEIKRTPPVDSTVRTADGNGVVTEINPLVGTIKVRLFSAPDTPPKLYRREDVIMLQKKRDNKEKNEAQESERKQEE